MYNRILLFCSTLFFVVTLSAQSEQYVGVTVSHTIELKALSTTYIVSPDPLAGLEYALDDLDEEHDYSEEQRDTDTDMLEIRKKLENKGIKCEDYKGEGDIPFYSEDGFLVYIDNEKNGKLLMDIVEEYDGFDANVYDVVFEEAALYLEKSLPVLHESARKEANVIAGSLNKKLGEIISIEEVQPADISSSLWGNYGQLLQRMMWKELNQDANTKHFELTYSYRFQLK